MYNHFIPPDMLSPEDYPDFDPLYARKPAKTSSITVELKAYTVLLDLFQAVFNHQTAPGPDSSEALRAAYEKAELFYRGQ